jgi:hypothetical protein
VIGDQDRERDPLAQGAGAFGGECFQTLLQAGIEGQTLDRAFGVGAMGAPGQMGGEHREGAACVRDRLAPGAVQFDGVDESGDVETLKDGVAGAAQGFGVAVGAARFGGLGKRDQQCRFRRRQPVRFMAEPGERSGAYSFEVAALRRQIEIGGEDGVLVQPSLQGQGQTHLMQLAGQIAGRASVEQTRQLHGDRRAAGDDAPVSEPLPGGAYERQRIDADMIAKAPVLDGLEPGQIARIDRIERDRQPPAPIGHGEGAQQPPLAVEDLRRASEFDLG